jgi:hypothetical protein
MWHVRVLVEKTERKRTLGTLGLRWENNIKTNLKEVCRKSIN